MQILHISYFYMSNNDNNKTTSEACVYSIPCNVCNQIYIGKTSRIIKNHIYEHIQDFKFGGFLNVLVIINLETKHGFNFKDSKMLVRILYWGVRDFHLWQEESEP